MIRGQYTNHPVTTADPVIPAHPIIPPTPSFPRRRESTAPPLSDILPETKRPPPTRQHCRWRASLECSTMVALCPGRLARLGRHPFKVEIRGSKPLRGTTSHHSIVIPCPSASRRSSLHFQAHTCPHYQSKSSKTVVGNSRIRRKSLSLVMKSAQPAHRAVAAWRASGVPKPVSARRRAASSNTS